MYIKLCCEEFKLGFPSFIVADSKCSSLLQHKMTMIKSSVADPDPNPDPHVFGPPGSGSLYHQAKIVRKTLIPTA
jgi:hypothetical protein